MQFYNVKTRKFIDIEESKLQTKKYVRTTKTGNKIVRYAVKAEYNGDNLTKFVREDIFKALTHSEKN